jgi:site-specific recombinase XerD
MRFIEHRAPFALDQIARVLAIPTKRSDEPLVPYLTDAEWHSLVDSPDVTAWCGLRDRALLYLAVTVGLRVSELVGAKLTDISLGTDPTIVIQGKGRRYRELPLWKSVAGEMRKWLASRGESDAVEIFIGQHRRALTRSGVEAIVRRHERKARKQCPSIATKRVSPHVLRHTCAMIVLRATGDLRKVALWLGHASIQTTEIYTRADRTEKLAAIETQLPPSLRPGRFRDADRVMRFLKMQASTNA